MTVSEHNTASNRALSLFAGKLQLYTPSAYIDLLTAHKIICIFKSTDDMIKRQGSQNPDRDLKSKRSDLKLVVCRGQEFAARTFQVFLWSPGRSRDIQTCRPSRSSIPASTTILLVIFLRLFYGIGTGTSTLNS